MSSKSYLDDLSQQYGDLSNLALAAAESGRMGYGFNGGFYNGGQSGFSTGGSSGGFDAGFGGDAGAAGSGGFSSGE